MRVQTGRRDDRRAARIRQEEDDVLRALLTCGRTASSGRAPCSGRAAFSGRAALRLGTFARLRPHGRGR